MTQRAFPSFAYPGGKAKLAPQIVRMFYPFCTRFVDVFSGRGNVTWAAMYYCTPLTGAGYVPASEEEAIRLTPHFDKFWMNCMGTRDFIRSLGGFYWLKEFLTRAAGRTTLPPPPTRPLYDQMKSQVLATPSVNPTRRGVTSFLKHADAMLMEGYACYQGGDYEGSRQKGDNTYGGVSPEGWRTKCLLATNFLSLYKPRITAWPYQRVLAQCGPNDMVYL